MDGVDDTPAVGDPDAVLPLEPEAVGALLRWWRIRRSQLAAEPEREAVAFLRRGLALLTGGR